MAIERIQLRRDTAANWSSVNPILAYGEPGFDTTNQQLKVGNGSTAWNSLPFLVGDGGGAGSPSNTDAVPEGTTNLYFSNARAQSALSSQLSAKAPLASPAFTGTPTGITKAHVGLANVDNTSDANKPVSTAQQTALDAKAPLASPAFTGTPTGLTKAHVGLGSVDNTSDSAKPVSTAQQTALDAKAPLASPAFTGTPTGITKSHVGLGSVDNTSDANKPVSTAQAAAINAKYTKPAGGITSADLSGPVVGALNNANSAVQSDESLIYTRRYSSGAWPVRGAIPTGSIVEWIGPTPPPIDSTYALAGVDLYSATVS
jgi:hypothetical protein